MAGNQAEFANFGGGFTDRVFDQRPSRCALNDNWVVDRDDRLTLRAGSYLFSPDEPTVGSAASRMVRLFSREDESLSGQKLFAFSKDTFRWASLPNGTFNAPTTTEGGYGFFSFDDYDTLSIAEWNRFLYLAKNAYSETGAGHVQPWKCYMGTSQDEEIFVPAGIPAVQDIEAYVEATLLATAITAANNLNAFLSDHFVDSTIHLTADNDSDGLLPADATNLATLITLTNGMVSAYTAHAQDEQTSRTFHTPDNFSSNCPQSIREWQTLPKRKDVETLAEACQRLDELLEVYNSHTISVVRHRGSVVGANYRLTTGYIGTVTVGPTIVSSYGYIGALLNSFKTKFNAHLADATAGTDAHDVADTVNPLVANAITDPSGSFAEARLRYDLHEFDSNASGASTYHPGTEASDHTLSRSRQNDPDFATGTPTANTYKVDTQYGFFIGDLKIPEFVEIFNDLVSKFNAHVDDLTAHYATASVTHIIAMENKAVVNTLEDASYVYGFAWARRYTKDNGLIAEDVGPISLRTASNRLAVEVFPIYIQGLPAALPTGWADLANGDAEIFLKIFRTTDSGSVLFLLDEVPLGESKFPGMTQALIDANEALLFAGTVAYLDRVTDDDLITREKAYTAGGTQDYNPPPKSKVVHVSRGYGYWGNIQDPDDDSVYANRIYQSIPGIPDAVPGDFFFDLPGEVIGISSHVAAVIAFSDGGVHRIEGRLDEKGQGDPIPVPISSKIGCISEGSIVQTDKGVIFWGSDGVYLTDGYSLVMLSDGWRRAYAKMVKDPVFRRTMTATYDSRNSLVYFGASRTGLDSNDIWLCLDMTKPLGAESCWTSGSGKGGKSSGYYDHFNPEALHYHPKSDTLFRGHGTGTVFQHDAEFAYDAYVDTSVDPSLWRSRYIKYDYQSCAQSFGSETMTKLTTQIDARFKPYSNLNASIQTNSDDFKRLSRLRPISYTAVEREDADGDAEEDDQDGVEFGTPDLQPFYKGLIKAKRHGVSPGLRSIFRQVRITNDYVTLYDSEDEEVEAVSISPGAKTATLSQGSFPADIEGQDLLLSTDAYTYAFEIRRRVSDQVLLLWDEEGRLRPSDSAAWRVKGFQKGQVPYLLSYTVRYDVIDTPHSSPGDSGALGAAVELSDNKASYRTTAVDDAFGVSDDLLWVDDRDGNRSITLPDASLNRNDGRICAVKKKYDSTSIITVFGYAGQMIDDALSYVIGVSGELGYKGTTVTFMAVDGNWILI